MSGSWRTAAACSHALVVAILLIATPGFTHAEEKLARTPENASVNKYGTGWLCDQGYRESHGECKAIDVPINAYATNKSFGRGWECKRGYRMVDEGCLRIEVPPNAYLDMSSGRSWRCRRGYRTLREGCVAIKVPENGYLSGTSYGPGWKCERGYDAIVEAGVALKLPENAHIDYSGNDWACNRPYRRQDDRCVPSSLN
jgi:hypothetical protein